MSTNTFTPARVALQQSDNSKRNLIEKQITEAAQKGKYELTVCKDEISRNLIEELKSAGYLVFSKEKNPYITIRWNNY